MGSLNFALVGCGRIGERHAEHISKNGCLKAVCDTDSSKADQLAQQYSSTAYTSIDELLKDSEIDVVSICTPNGLHTEHSILAFRAGFHVLCEKPMAIKVVDCGRMINEAEKANKRLFIVKQNRFNPPVAALKKAIDEGKLGKILSAQVNCFWNRNFDYYNNSDWKGTRELDGGTLFTQFSHFIDLIYWMLGDVKKVYAATGNFAHLDTIEFEDTGAVILEFFSGAIGSFSYTVNSYNKNMEGSITVFGEKGTVKVGGQYLNELEYQNIEGFEITNLPKGNSANDYGHYQGSMSNHGEVYENVVDVLTNKGVIATNGFEGLKTVEIIDKIYTYARAQKVTHNGVEYSLT
ncbi:MAG: oxidoreductase [Bacteroidetes bacterium]|nr:Gfo/Idh/MocA family oxidoreductase [Bacteroidia bacterium]PCH65288.1 MAG: oxidoreductase [Bacteroidota bacterium]